MTVFLVMALSALAAPAQVSVLRRIEVMHSRGDQLVSETAAVPHPWIPHPVETGSGGLGTVPPVLGTVAAAAAVALVSVDAEEGSAVTVG